MTRICFFSGDITRSGGTERVSTQLTNLLSNEDGYDICFMSLTEKNEKPFYFISPTIQRYHLSKKWINPGPGYIPLIGKLRTFLKEHDIDIIIDIDIVLDVLSIPASMGLKTKVVSWEHFNCEFEQTVLYRKLISRLTAHSSDYIVTLTEDDKQSYGTMLGRTKNIQAIYNPVPVMHCDESIERNNWIVTTGRLTYQKGTEYLIEVAKEVLKQHPDWQWLLLGEGEDRPVFEKAIEENHLENHLILKGIVENVEWYLNRSKLFVLTSRYEGFGMCLVEALQMHVPCISFDIETGPSEIITDNKNGYLISPFDSNAMIKAINMLIENPELLNQMKENAMLGFERYQEETIVNQWKQILNALSDE